MDAESNQDKSALWALRAAKEALKRSRPGDRSDKDRWYQITITDMEKTIGSFYANVLKGEEVQ